MEDDLSFLLTAPPTPKAGDDGFNLPFPPGSFARECVAGWLREADLIDCGALKLPGRLGEIIAAANRDAARRAVENPELFNALAEQSAKFN